ncbi:MAG: flavodoxin family protein [Anaerolineae bacterium]
MHIIAFNGSPRPRGNTTALVGEILRGAVSAGATTEEIMLNKLVIRPCQACETCKKSLHCRLNDDMQPLYEKLLASDAVVFGTPIYFWSMSAQMKAFVDRLYALDLDPIRPRLVNKRLALACAYADSTVETASGAVFAFRSAAEYFKMRFYEPLLVTAGEPGDAAHNPLAMQSAFTLGVNIATP